MTSHKNMMAALRPVAVCWLALVASAACSSNSDGSAGTGGSTASGGAASGGVTSGGAASGGAASGGAASGGAASGGVTAAGAASGGATSGGGGAAASGGAAGASTAGAPGCAVKWTGSMTRPQLDDASAECFTIKNYLAQAGTIGSLVKDDWDPTAGVGDVATFTPNFTVAADGSGTHTTVQAAIDAANAVGGTARLYILVKPGPYRELVCVKGAVPITLYGADSDAKLVTIAYDNYNGKTLDTAHSNACVTYSSTTYGTSGSSTFFVSAPGFQAKNLTIANDFAEGTTTSSIQAVALTAQGDKAVFENVRLIGNQDTLQVKSAAATGVARSYFKKSYIEGDTDFVFGRGTAVFDECTITFAAARKANGAAFAPSTESSNGFGFLVIKSTLLSDASAPTATAGLGRAWDDSSATMPNGQVVIRESEIGAQIVVATPWQAAATSSRAYTADGNRMYEYKNTGPGAAAP
ncbi:MAG: pectinesterase family protein [Polyangiaceae bacterium]